VREYFWAPGHGLHGLFEPWSFQRVVAVVSSGLGGGSLIYANVMLRKDPATFAADGMIVTPEELEPHYEAVEAMQGATRYPFVNETPKTRAIIDAGAKLGLPVELPKLAIAFAPAAGAAPQIGVPLAPAPNLHDDAPRTTCHLCGQCDVGCNTGSKNTLDFTYLSAAVAAGAQIRTCCEALGLEPHDGGWRVRYRQHVGARDGHPQHLLDPSLDPQRVIEAGSVIVAAGTLGSNKLLLRNRAALPRLSRRLGAGFSGNGDHLLFLRGADRYLDPSRGPVITASMRVSGAASPSGRAFLLQDGGAPAGTEWVWQGFELPGDLWRMRGTFLRRAIDRARGRSETALGGLASEALGTARNSAAMMPLLAIGRDVPDGRLMLRGDSLDLSWRPKPSRAYYKGLEATARRLGAAMGGRAWRPGGPASRLVTVHPLGGCAMGPTPERGVVDAWGRVFGYEGLFVADGAILPGPVGSNPGLTIAALADRIADGMLAR
jgi:cholesterol oxidase